MNIKNKKINKGIRFILIISAIIFSLADKSLASDDWSKFNTWETKASTNKYSFGGKSTSVGDKIYSFGGLTLGESTPRFEIYDTKTDTWTVQPDMPYPTRYQGCESVGDNIYVFGGQTIDDPVTDVMYCYNTKTDTWTQKASMLEPKRSFATGVIDGKIYVAGGFGTTYLKSLDCYDPETNTWTKLSDMPTKRSSNAGIGSNGKFYVLGGWNNEAKDTYISTVEVYNPRTNTWETKCNSPLGILSVAIEEYEGYIYMVGGRNPGNDSVDTLLCYSTYADKWITLASMPTPRYNYNIARVEDKLYVANGSVGGTPYKITEMYNIPNQAFLTFAFAKKYKTIDNIDRAREKCNELSFSLIRSELTELINSLVPDDLYIDKNGATSSVDIYLKPKNMLTLTIDTNNIVFEDFDGVESIEKLKAFNLTVESSLPYSVEVCMPIGIVDENNTTVLDNNLISIKESSTDTYLNFNNSMEYLILLDNQLSGNRNQHSIDIKLNARVLPETKVYKAVLKFKVEQK